MTAILYAKLVGAAAALVFLFGLGYHFGGMASKTAEEAARAAQLSAVATAYQNQVLAAQASETQLQKVENAYDALKDTPDPVTTGLATRVLYRACPADRGDVPQAKPVAAGASALGAQPGGDPSLAGRLQAVLDACTADARQLDALIKLAPQ